MYFINSRGQAFDTFKLMIAAVVAVAILAILLGILRGITPPATDVKSATNNLLKQCAGECGQMSSDIIRYKGTSGDRIGASEVAQGTGISASKVSFQNDAANAPPDGVDCAADGISYSKNVDANGRIKVSCTSGECTVTCAGP